MAIFYPGPGGVLRACAGFTGAGFQQDWGIYFWKDGSGWVGDCRFVINGLFWDDMSRNGVAKA